MRIFFNLDKNKENIDSIKIIKDIEKIKKDKYREFSDSFYFKSPIGEWGTYVSIALFNFGIFLDTILSNPVIQEFWNDVKERVGKDVDEQELLKVFKFYMFITYLFNALNNTIEIITTNAQWGYDVYRDITLFDGKLDFVTFKELMSKIGKYINSEEFNEKYGQNKEQKDEQPK
jgi:hypothetical protein